MRRLEHRLADEAGGPTRASSNALLVTSVCGVRASAHSTANGLGARCTGWPPSRQARLGFVDLEPVEAEPQRLPDGNATGHSAHRHALSSRVARVFLKVSAHPACVNFVLESTSGALFGTHFVEPLGPEIGRGGSAGVFED